MEKIKRFNVEVVYDSEHNVITEVRSFKYGNESEPEIYIMTKDGNSPQRITFNNNGDTLPNWSPKDINLLITGFRNGSYQICKILLKEPL